MSDERMFQLAVAGVVKPLHQDKREAPKNPRNKLHVYECPFCYHFHLGRVRSANG